MASEAEVINYYIVNSQSVRPSPEYKAAKPVKLDQFGQPAKPVNKVKLEIITYRDIKFVLNIKPYFVVGRLVADKICQLEAADHILLADNFYIYNQSYTQYILSKEKTSNGYFNFSAAEQFLHNKKLNELKFRKLFIDDSLAQVLHGVTVDQYYQYTKYDLVNDNLVTTEQLKALIALENSHDLSSLDCLERFKTFLIANITNLEQIKRLLELGADINKANNWLETPFIVSCNFRNYRSDIFRYLIDQGAMGELTGLINLCSAYFHKNGPTLADFEYLFEQTNIKTVINNSTEPEEDDDYTCVALDILLRNLAEDELTTDHLALIKLFLEQGANPNLGHNVIKYTIKHRPAFELLLSYGAKIDGVFRHNIIQISAIGSEPLSANFTLLHMVCRGDHSLVDFEFIVRKLVELGLDINKPDHKSITPVMDLLEEHSGSCKYDCPHYMDDVCLANCTNLLAKLNIMLELGANINARDCYGRTIIYCISYRDINIMKYGLALDKWDSQIDFGVEVLTNLIIKCSEPWGRLASLHKLNYTIRDYNDIIDYVLSNPDYDKGQRERERGEVIYELSQRIAVSQDKENCSDLSVEYPHILNLMQRLIK